MKFATCCDDVTGNRNLNWAARACGKCSPIEVNERTLAAFSRSKQPLLTKTKLHGVFLFGDESLEYISADFLGSKAKILRRYALKVIHIMGTESGLRR